MTIRSVYFEITNRCNMNCQTCYNRSGLNKITQEILVDQLENAMTFFSRHGCSRFLLSGGEPTLHSEFDQILCLIQKHPEWSFGIATNGTNRHSDLLHYLNQYSNITLQVSLDGSNEKINSRTRGTGHYSKIVSFLQQVRPQSAQLPYLKIVLSKFNYLDINSFYELSLHLNCIPEFTFLHRSGNAVTDWANIHLTDFEKSQCISAIHQLNKRHHVEAALPLCAYSCPYTAKDLTNLALCVKSNGDIQPCQSLYDESFKIGNILQLSDSVFSDSFKRIQSLALQRTQADFGCSRCIIQNACQKGCMANAYNLHGDPLAEDNDCLLRKQQFIAYKLKNENVLRISEK